MNTGAIAWASEVPALTVIEKLVLMLLAARADQRGAQVFDLDSMARQTGMSRAASVDLMFVLQDRGLVEIEADRTVTLCTGGQS